MNPIRLGAIGAGVMANFSIYPALYMAPFSLQAICDIDAEKAAATAQKFGTGRWYTDAQQMYASETLDAVLIHMHAAPRQRLVLDALDRGYHVFVPKPPAMDLTGTIDIADAARRAGKIVMVNFQRRFSFAVREAIQCMAEPGFGRLTQLSCSFCSGKYSGPDNAHRGVGYDNPIHAYLLDFAPHHLDLARTIGGEVSQMAVYHETVNEGISLAAALKFERGGVGTLQLNSQRIWWRNYDRIEITGEREYLVLESLWSLRHYKESGNSFTENYSDQRSAELTGDAHALIEFAEAIQQNREPTASIHDCVETMRLYQILYDAVQHSKEGVVLP